MKYQWGASPPGGDNRDQVTQDNHYTSAMPLYAEVKKNNSKTSRNCVTL